MEELFIIVGLGNPGLDFINTRHNVGFDTIDYLAQKNDIKVSRLKFRAYIGEGMIEGRRVILVKPVTYMNLSGESVRDIVEWYKVDMSHLILVYDDADIPLGKIRIRPGGSAGTHNGMKSVIYHLQRDDFPRIRIGIGHPPEGRDMVDFVLGKFSREERELINNSIQRAAEAACTILSLGINAAMNKYNS